MNKKNKKNILRFFLIIISIILISINAINVFSFDTGVIDGYVFNSTGHLFIGADVKITIGSCTGDYCNKTDVSDANGYYGVVNLECNNGRLITVTANGTGGWQGTNDTVVCTGPNDNHRVNVTMCKAPNVPVLNLQSDTHNKEVTLSWTNDTADNHIYEFRVAGGGWSTNNDATSPQYESGLSFNTNYEWRVRSCQGACCSLWAEDSFYVYNNPPSAPNLTAQPDTPAFNVSLYWTSNYTRAEYYDIDGDLVHDEYQFESNAINYSATPPQIEEGLSNGVFDWKVRSCDNTSDASTGCSVWVSDSFTIDNNAPATPVLDFQADTHNLEVNLSWASNATRSQTDEDGDPVHDEFYFREGGSGCSGGTLLYSDTSASPTKTISNLEMYKTYSWCIKSCDHQNACSSASSSFSTINDVPPVPTLTDMPNTDSTILDFEWINYSDPDPEDSTHNEFQLSTSSTFSSFSEDATNVSSPYTVGGILSLTYYYWRVRTCDNYNCSDWSEDSFFTYSCPTCPVCPSGGGGGGGGSCPTVTCPTCICDDDDEECYPNWVCGDWSSCNLDSESFRLCYDANDCVDDDDLPDEKQSCSYTPEYNVTIIEEPVIIEEPAIIQEIANLFEKEVEVSTSITSDNLNLNTISSCDGKWLDRIELVSETDFQIPDGKTIASTPFKVNCIDNLANITVNIPDSFTNLELLKCKNKQECERIPIKKLDELVCQLDIFKQAHEKADKLDLGNLKTITPKRSDITQDGDVIISDRYSLKFSEINKNMVASISTGSELPPEGNLLKVISGQLLIELKNIDDGAYIEATLPYIKQNIDENSIGVYARDFRGSSTDWIYLGGTIDKKTRTITIKFPIIGDVLNNRNQMVLAAISTVCIACEGVEFNNVHNPVPLTKDAVIFVHGFGSEPATFEPIINDIRLTNQPWQVWTYAYPSDEDFNTIARRFANKIEENIRNFDNIYIVAHSLGGLVTEKALRYSYDENKKTPGTYKFTSRVRKALIIGSPHKGSPGAELYTKVFTQLSKEKDAANLYNIESPIMDILLEGIQIQRVPGIEYLVIAGTKGYGFSSGYFKDEVNDGLVSVDSATFVGDDNINDLCNNYWEIATTHTDILKNPISRKLVQKIIAKEIAESLGVNTLMGFISYYELADESCEDDSTYVFVGTELNEEQIADETMCACGNGYCGEGENEMNCPSDCATVFREENMCIILLFIILISSILFSIFLVLAVQKMYSLNAFSNLSIAPLIFILISVFSMIIYVFRGCYVLWAYRTVTIILSVISISIAVVLVVIMIVKNKIKTHFVKLRREEDLKKLEKYIYKSMTRNISLIKKKLIRMGWRLEDTEQIIKKVRRKVK